MLGLWWTLPGPSQFLDRLEQDLRQGRSIVLALPEYPPPGLELALEQRVRLDGMWYWERLPVLAEFGATESPSAMLRRKAPICLDAPVLVTPDYVAACPEFSGSVFCITGLDEASWRHWRMFLEQYQHACRRCPPADRALFCVFVVGELADCMPAEDVALSVRKWQAVSDRLDMTIYLSHLLRNSDQCRLRRDLSISIGTELCGTDVGMAEEWAQLSFDEVLRPLPFLEAYAIQRGWTSATGAPSWGAGTADVLEKQSYPHSASLAIKGDEWEICRRIWKGQVRVLFPFVEEQRIRMSDLMQPYSKGAGDQSCDLRDMEIGQLHYQAVQWGVPYSLVRQLRCLKDMRHSLAHLRPVDPADLQSPEIKRCMC